MNNDLNVLGEPLQPCSMNPLTGFYRDGCCKTGEDDRGKHIVCAQMTEDFLNYTKSRGNDLSTAIPQFGFPGLKPGDQWCLCASRWKEALDAGMAPPIRLRATHEAALEIVSLDGTSASRSSRCLTEQCLTSTRKFSKPRSSPSQVNLPSYKRWNSF
jgi:uncharacterized protein (DUF2237 family)